MITISRQCCSVKVDSLLCDSKAFLPKQTNRPKIPKSKTTGSSSTWTRKTRLITRKQITSSTTKSSYLSVRRKLLPESLSFTGSGSFFSSLTTLSFLDFHPLSTIVFKLHSRIVKQETISAIIWKIQLQRTWEKRKWTPNTTVTHLLTMDGSLHSICSCAPISIFRLTRWGLVCQRFVEVASSWTRSTRWVASFTVAIWLFLSFSSCARWLTGLSLLRRWMPSSGSNSLRSKQICTLLNVSTRTTWSESWAVALRNGKRLWLAVA